LSQFVEFTKNYSGVGGFTLGGGYSWKTQKFGLACDNVLAFNLVTPTSQILTVTAQSHPDLFFGLKVI